MYVVGLSTTKLFGPLQDQTAKFKDRQYYGISHHNLTCPTEAVSAPSSSLTSSSQAEGTTAADQYEAEQ